MALSRRTGTRFQASIWPGFVDAMTGLLLVLMFVLTIFMVVQFVLRETITGQASKLDELSAEVAALAQALGLEQDRNATLTDRVGELTSTLGDAREREQQQAALIAQLQNQTAQQAEALSAAQSRIASFEEQVAGLLSERDTALGQVAELEGERDALLSEQEALELTLASLREEVDAQSEAARLAAARREALEALVADLRQSSEETQNEMAAQIETLESELSEAEKTRLAEAAAAEALREKLQNADSELSAMTLALEEQRKRAEETLTLLAAARDAQEDLDTRLAAALLDQEETSQSLADRDARIAALEEELRKAETGASEANADLATLRAELDATKARLAEVVAQSTIAETQALEAEEVRAQLTRALAAKEAAEAQAAETMTEAEERAALLAQARAELAEQEEIASEAQKQQALLNRQVSALRDQLGQLQALLDDAKAREAAQDVQIQSLGRDLNAALARVAAEERARAKLLEEQNQNLEKYRSEFFGRLRDLLGAQEGVRIVGDRFVFSSEVLFAPGEAELSTSGEREIAKVADILRNVISEIPEGIDWVLQVDGHTDNVPVRAGAEFADNWELSQARALSVVRYMINFLGLPPERLSANGFGQYQPVNGADTPDARAQNRRIELKFTGK
ncbi:peptidoglycan -binding protein [Roseovarius sp. MMSF_3281]|uniref:peptidoglycan -binding protein n=1 Tax=Roseovarius sp. MMSF_3281 TaxID=3046694 RepID=UPI00273D8916|nr:peptidoglycan -binding protein [Roseovarius sp. MMSF_3281]